jgi:lipoprotein-anchoring transpeptidase ErfK/SrfK
MIGAAVSVWIVVAPTSHADGAQQPRQAAAADTAAKTTTKTKPAPQHLAPAPKSVVGKPAAPAPVQRWKYADKCPEKALACVDLKDKVSWLQVNGVVMYGPVRIEPGSPGQVTPTGVFAVDRKDKHHISNEFDEPMPDAVFFAPGGIAFHEGSLTKGSHGCVHLSWKDANYYYEQLQIGDTVAVF